MNERVLKDLLAAVKDGTTSIDAAAAALSQSPVADLGFARLDHHRELRCGFAEVVFCQGKEAAHVGAIAANLAQRSDRVLLTRASAEQFAAVERTVPHARYHATARVITIDRVDAPTPEPVGLVAVLTAGTADIPVAEEAALTARQMGARVETRFDVGVAGIHRLFAQRDLLREARVLVVVAGMEGALASVVGGLVARPVVAVPTSIGYGASFQGLAALLSMLNACAPNVAVVNIDNGFGAGYLAALINGDEPGVPRHGSRPTTPASDDP